MGADRAREGEREGARRATTPKWPKRALVSRGWSSSFQGAYSHDVHNFPSPFSLTESKQSPVLFPALFRRHRCVLHSTLPQICCSVLSFSIHIHYRAADGYGFPFWQPRPFQGSWKLLPPMAAMALIALLRCVANVLPRCRAPSAPRFTVASLSLTSKLWAFTDRLG